MNFQLFVIPTIPGFLEDGARLRPIGRNNERFQQMLAEVRKICLLADELGFDCFSTSEHHFHSEGFEASVAPVLIYADLAARTKQIKFAPLGLVLPTWDPIRCAEEIAMLDHLTQGRVIAGFARGYQDRWVGVMGQKYKAVATLSDDSSADVRNREIFEEMFEIVKAAWCEDALEFKGKYYQVPHPYEEGIRGWPALEWTRERGAPGEVDEEGVLRKVCVIPRPYQEPHPPIFNAHSMSESTILWAAKVGSIPQILAGNPPHFTRLCELYRTEAAKHGRDLKLGENIGACRYVCIGKTREEAYEMLSKTAGWVWQRYFSQFGVHEALRYEGEDSPRPLEIKTTEDAAKRLVDHQIALVGTVDEIKRQLEPLARCHADGELEWFDWEVCQQGLLPTDEVLEQIELFGTKILPEFRN